MSAALIGSAGALGWAAVKSLAMFAVAVAGLRLSGRRTVGQLGVFDFVVTVAIGAIVGRTATSSTTSFLVGVVALVVLLTAHHVVAVLQRADRLGGLLQRPPLAIVADGVLREPVLASAGLTRRDALRLLRQAGVGDPTEVRYVLFEEGGAVSLIPWGDVGAAYRAGLREAGIEADAAGRTPRPG